MQSDIEIAQGATMKKITEVAKKLGIDEEHLEPYGHYKAKLSLEYINSLKDKPNGKLILTTAISPTPPVRGRPPPPSDWATRSTGSARRR
jgi:formate--tetrahydrofolate ligase